MLRGRARFTARAWIETNPPGRKVVGYRGRARFTARAWIETSRGAYQKLAHIRRARFTARAWIETVMDAGQQAATAVARASRRARGLKQNDLIKNREFAAESRALHGARVD